MKTYFYRNYATREIIFRTNADNILAADALLLAETGIVAAKVGGIGCWSSMTRGQWKTAYRQYRILRWFRGRWPTLWWKPQQERFAELTAICRVKTCDC